MELVGIEPFASSFSGAKLRMVGPEGFEPKKVRVPLVYTAVKMISWFPISFSCQISLVLFPV